MSAAPVSIPLQRSSWASWSGARGTTA